jgi:hypothetical protein
MRNRRGKLEIVKLVGSKVPGVRVFSTPGASLIDLKRTDFVIATYTDVEAEALRKDYPASIRNSAPR